MKKMAHANARMLLAKMRPFTSLLEKESLVGSAGMVCTKSNWVPLYYDRGRRVASHSGKHRVDGYHSVTLDPFDATDMANRAWELRRSVRQDWDQVERTARDLICGRQRFDIRIEDVRGSPLCQLEFDAVRQAIGMGRVCRIPGRLAALLMKIEPKMGFLIHAAMQRQKAADADNQQQIGRIFA